MSKAIRSFLGKIRSGKQIKSTTPPQKPEDPRVIAARSVC